MRDPKITAAIACAIAGCLAVGTASASYTAQVETANTVKIDTVDIEAESSAQADPILLFGSQKATCATTIENKGVACWLRVRIDAAGPIESVLATGVGTIAGEADGSAHSGEADGEAPDDAAGESEAARSDAESGDASAPGQARWMLGADGCYYLLDVLEEGASVEFVEAVSHRADESWDGEGFDVERQIVAEAVQARAFEPDFEADLPWGDIEPQQSIHARTGGDR